MVIWTAETVFDGGEFVGAGSAILAVGESDMDLTPVAAFALIFESDFVISCIAEVSNIFLTFVTIHPAAIVCS